MSTERRGVTRRAVLRAAGATGLAGLAGCAGGAGTGARAGTADDGDGGQSTTVAILAAGSLQHALETGLVHAVDVPVEVEAHGSATLARMIAEGQRDPDIVTVADTALFADPLSPPWYATFASNAVVVAYNPDTEGGRRVAEAGRERWYEPIVDGDVRIGRTDPDQDPLGYRTLFTLELASRYYDGAPDLRERVPDREQVYPETALISQFETGAIDAAFAYRNMAVERGYDYVDLPGRIDLGDPRYAADWYSTVSYTLPGGQTVAGDLIGYGSTIRKPSDAARSVFVHHTTGSYLAEAGFLLRDRFPVYEGAVPERVRRATDRATEAGRLRPSGGTLATTVSDLTILR
jgi:molybdate/tungstate transport system substrate-binding protein